MKALSVDWSNLMEVREYQRKYQRKYRQSETVKERNRERYYRNHKPCFRSIFDWDDIAARIREDGVLDITQLPKIEQRIVCNAAEKGVIRLEGNLAYENSLTHALDGYVT